MTAGPGPGRLLLGVVTVVTALLLQTAVLSRLPVPGSPPDLVLLVVIAFALAEGSGPGMVTGFAAGLLADLQSDHELGRLALAYVVVGFVAGRVHDDTERSTLLPFLVVLGGALTALAVYAGAGLVLGDPRTTLSAAGLGLVSSVAYDVVLTPFVVPLVGLLVRRVDPDPVRR